VLWALKRSWPDLYERLGYGREDPIVGGFSQGAMVASLAMSSWFSRIDKAIRIRRQDPQSRTAQVLDNAAASRVARWRAAPRSFTSWSNDVLPLPESP
jgi:hypothetical protein